MIDLSSAIYTFLSGQATVTALAGTRIWGDSNFPPQSYRPDDGPALTFRPRGGLMSYHRKVWNISYQFKFYGETDSASLSPQASAFALYDAVFDVLDEAAFAPVRYAYFSVPMQAFTENFPTTWPFLLAFVDFVALNEP